MSRIFITGDTHGDIDYAKLNTRQFKEQKNLTKDDYVIVLGDFGVLWNSYTKYCPDRLSKRDLNFINWYESKNFTTLWIDGNHDNHIAIKTFPIEEWNGGKIHRISDTLIHLMRGQVYNIDGKVFFTIGGADSIDKLYRVENVSWWKEEMPSYDEYVEAMNNLEKVNFKVDYVLTHCCGTQLLPKLFTMHNNGDELTQFLWHLEKDFGLDFKHWYFGHHHQDKQIDDKHTCLYQNIIEL
jgi:predicted phosphodiesterase